MQAKELFKKFSHDHANEIPFTFQYSWWDEVVKDHWEVAVVTKDDEVIGVWPYYTRRKGLWKMVGQPHYTPYTGPYIVYPNRQKNEKRIGYENKVLKALLKQLPDFSEYIQKLHLDFSNTLPLIWEGFEDTKGYTYLLDLDQKNDELWKGFSESCRRQINKAEKTLKIEETEDGSILDALVKESYAAQEEENPIKDSALYDRIVRYFSIYSAGKVFKAVDENEVVHAAIAVAWDKNAAYYLIGGSATDLRQSGANSLLMWEAIKEAKRQRIKQFNFEGSMVPSIEKFLRGFGGELHPYSILIKNNSKTLQIAKSLKK